MRIDALHLLRYGPFTDRRLDLSDPEVRLWIVYGPNEAGKSSALRALGDWLFGFGNTSNANFIHAYEQLQVGGTLSAPGRDPLTCLRHKKKINDLLLPDHKPLDKEKLRAFLGDVTRVQFGTFYGLDHTALRKSGEDLLEAKGDLGQILFHAAGGERAAMDLLARLEKEADDLFTPRRVATKPYYQAVDAFTAARTRFKEAQIQPDGWLNLQRRHDEARSQREALQQREGELNRRRARLERIRRLRPLLDEWRRAGEELARLPVLPALPVDAQTQFEAAQKQRELAHIALQREEEALRQLEDKLAVLPEDGEILRHKEEIGNLFEHRGVIRQERGKLPGLRLQQDNAKTQIQFLLQQMGGPHAPEAVAEHMPPATLRTEVRKQVTNHATLLQRLKEKRDNLADAQAAMAQGVEQLARLPVPPDETKLRQALEEGRAAVVSPARMEQRQREIATARRKVQRGLSALPFWPGEVEDLAALSVPLPESLTPWRQERDEFLALKGKHLVEVDASRQRRDAALADRNSLLADEGGRDEVDVASARRQRDALWQGIYDHLTANAPPPAPAQVEQFQHAMGEADRKADRRLEDAARQERLALKKRHLEQAEEAHARAQGELEKINQRLEDWDERWQAWWSPCRITPATPVEMEAWLHKRAEILDQREELQHKEEDWEADRQAMDQAGNRLRFLLEIDAAEMDLDALLRRGESQLQDWADQRVRRQGLEEAQNTLELTHRAAAFHLENAQRDVDSWQRAWEKTLPRLSLPLSATPAEAEQALTLWEGCEKAWQALETHTREITEQEERARAFSQRAHDLSLQAGLPPMGEDATAWVEALHQRLQQAGTNAKLRDNQIKQREDVQQRARKLTQQREEARDALHALAHQAQCAPDELPERLVQHSRRLALQQEGDSKRAAILEAGDGLTLEEAQREVGEITAMEELRTELDRLNEELPGLSQERERLSEEIQRLATEMERISTSEAVNQAAQEMETARVAMEEHGHRWLTLRAARLLLDKGLERFRDAHQSHMVARAAQIFQHLTLGAFRGIRVDYGRGDHPGLLGERANRTTCPPEGMSDGTRDQLFLALRLAALEERLAGHGPFPFVADDLFVHFDDARTRAGLETLLALGEQTQVLFFTHHQQVVESAQRCASPGAVRVIELPPFDPSRPNPL